MVLLGLWYIKYVYKGYNMIRQKHLMKPIALACLGSIILGSSAIFVRISDLGPISTGFYRMLFALPLLAIWVKWEQSQRLVSEVVPSENRGVVFLAGFFFALDLAVWNWSIDYTTVVNSTLFNNTAVFFVPLISWFFFKEKPSLQFIMTVIIGFIGCLCLLGGKFSGAFTNFIGDFVALVSGVLVAAYLISIQQIRGGMSTGLLMFWTGLVSLFFLGLFAYMSGESFWPFTYKDALSFFGQAVLVHLIGQSLLAYSLGQIPAAYAALILFLAPVTAAILGWVIYAEALGPIEIIGMVLIMVSIMAVRKKV